MAGKGQWRLSARAANKGEIQSRGAVRASATPHLIAILVIFVLVLIALHPVQALVVHNLPWQAAHASD